MAESRIERRLRYLRSGTNANFTIKCKDREWKVDRGILSAESEYFEKLCIGAFAEATEGQATFDEQEPQAIDQILVYIYAGTYDDLAVLHTPSAEDININDTPATSASGNRCPGNSIPANDTAETSLEVLGDALPSVVKWRCKKEYPKAPALEEATKADVTKVLKTAIGVYACAEMMGLSELKELTVTKFFQREQYFINADFADVIQTLFQVTAIDDMAMRREGLERCIDNDLTIVLGINDDTAALDLIKEHEPMGWSLGCAFALKASIQEIKAGGWEQKYLNQCQTNEQQADVVKSLVAQCHRLDEDLADMNDAHRFMQTGECRKCGRELTCSKWITQRSSCDRPQYMCKCGVKYTASRQRR